MNKKWLLSVLLISFTLLTLLKARESATLVPYIRGERTIKLKNFSQAKNLVSPQELDHLELWESILTGRVGPVAKWMRERYRKMGLSHLFTPSGFHISAVLFPIMIFLKGRRLRLIFLLLLNLGAVFLPGMSALKRMLLIKAHQNAVDQHRGFILALVLDVLFGSFQKGPLSFTYSFLFIGVIYSGLKGLPLVIWFFIAQAVLAFFQGSEISPLLLVFSPVLNLAFSMAMPLLFLLAIPLWRWQLSTGLYLIKALQRLVDLLANISAYVPALEVNVGLLLFLALFLYKKWRAAVILLFFLSSGLNPDHQRTPSFPAHAFVPEGRILKAEYGGKDVKIVFQDGTCKLRLIRGLWWENCSPKRRSRGKKLRKLSYPSGYDRRSSLHGWHT